MNLIGNQMATQHEIDTQAAIDAAYRLAAKLKQYKRNPFAGVQREVTTAVAEVVHSVQQIDKPLYIKM